MLKLMCPLPLAIITRDMRDERLMIGIIKWPKNTPPKFIVFLDKKKRTLLNVKDYEGHTVKQFSVKVA